MRLLQQQTSQCCWEQDIHCVLVTVSFSLERETLIHFVTRETQDPPPPIFADHQKTNLPNFVFFREPSASSSRLTMRASRVG